MFAQIKDVREFLSDISFVVCESHNFVYLKPPRTAGTSIYRLKMAKELKLETINKQDNKIKFRDWLDGLTLKKWNNYFKFSASRNPWDRMVSAFMYLRQFRLIEPKDHVREFRKFINNIDYWWEIPSIKRHCMPCIKYTHWKGNQVADFIIKFENLKEDIECLFKKLNLPLGKLPHHNSTKHNHYSVYYDKKTEDTVREIYSEDIKEYGYYFQLIKF